MLFHSDVNEVNNGTKMATISRSVFRKGKKLDKEAVN